MKEYILIFLSVIFADNILFTKMLGLEFSLALRKEKELAPIFWVTTIVVSALASVGAQILGEKGLGPIICGVLFAGLGVVCGYIFDVVFKNTKTAKTFATALAMNTAFLGIAFAMSSVEGTMNALIVGLSHGVGLMLSALMMNCIEERVKYSRPPKILGKTLLTLICVAVVAMAFSAFDGFELRYENINS